MASAWGLLPLAVPLAVTVAVRLGAILFAGESVWVASLGGALLAVALFVSGVRGLGAVGLLRGDLLFGGLGVMAGLLLVVQRDRQLHLPWRKAVCGPSMPVLVIAVSGLVVAVFASLWLPIWQWDSLGYHLPFVNFALQRGHLSDVPKDVPYLATYPHNVELFYVAFRAMLPDDRLVELGHLALGLVGALATAALARQAGARAEDAVASGAVWLTLPAVFLQLPTNYVDVASVSFLLAACVLLLEKTSRATLLGASVALGLYLGSKPSSPPGTLLLTLVLVLQARRASLLPVAVAGVALIAFLGGESFFSNTLRHGNPIWPVRVSLGPFHLPGTLDMSSLLLSGAVAERAHGVLPIRVLRSWISLDASPVFDMRLGGLGPLFLAALPLAMIRTVRQRATQYLAPILATLASPDPAVARYVLGFPALILALATPLLAARSQVVRYVAFSVVAAVAIWNLAYAVPGLTGDGPPLLWYAWFGEKTRETAVGAAGRPIAFREAVAALAPGETTAFDGGMDLPYLAWPPDLSRSAVRIPDDAKAEQIDWILRQSRVRLLVAGHNTPAEEYARENPGRFVARFACSTGSCTVFTVQ